MAKKITPGEHNMNMAKKAGNALLNVALGPVGKAAVLGATGGVYDVLTRKDNQASSAMVEKANNDKSVTENYGLPRDQWRNKSINPQESLKVELKARREGYVPPSERNKPKEATKQDTRPRGRIQETGRSSVTPQQEFEMMKQALKKSGESGPQGIYDPVKEASDFPPKKK